MLKLVPVLLATYILRPADRQWIRIKEALEATTALPISMNVFCTFATAECFAGDSVPAMVGAGTNNKGVHTVGDRAKTVYALILGYK